MLKSTDMSRRHVREKVDELRSHLGLFSFEEGAATGVLPRKAACSSLFEVRPGGIIEWLVEREGAGGATLAWQLMARSSGMDGVWAVVDHAGECYVPALPGWGIDHRRVMVLSPATLQETCWSIEQCLRCPGVSATWAWVDDRIPAAGSSPLADGSGSGGRGGHVLSTGSFAAATDLGRHESAGHSAVRRPGRNQAGLY